MGYGLLVGVSLRVNNDDKAFRGWVIPRPHSHQPSSTPTSRPNKLLNSVSPPHLSHFPQLLIYIPFSFISLVPSIYFSPSFALISPFTSCSIILFIFFSPPFSICSQSSSFPFIFVSSPFLLLSFIFRYSSHFAQSTLSFLF